MANNIERIVRTAQLWIRKKRYATAIAWILLGFVVFTCFLLVILRPMSWLVGGGPVRHLHGFDQATALNAVRQTLLTAFAGAAALVALGFTVRTYYLSRRGQVTDRFNKAIGQLASDKLEERLGGIFALEHVMAESPTDHVAVLGVLCAFVRTRTLRPVPAPQTEDRPELNDEERPTFGTEPPPDIDAAMIAIARRPQREEPNRPDLRRAGLTGLSIRIYDFAKPPRLTHMFLTAADLRSADLRGSDLRRSIFTGADLRWAWLDNADLSRTGLSRARLRKASLRGANLTGAKLEGADLRDVSGLTAKQLSHAMINEKTLLPSELANDPWVQARRADCAALPDDAGPWACPSPTPKPTDLNGSVVETAETPGASGG
jgi:hypothetical protein